MSDSPTWNELDAITKGKSTMDLAEEIWRLKQRAEGVPQWIPVGKGWPEFYDTVLLNCDGELRSTGFLRQNGGGVGIWSIDAEDPSDGSRWIVTHWMPLPACPDMNSSRSAEQQKE